MKNILVGIVAVCVLCPNISFAESPERFAEHIADLKTQLAALQAQLALINGEGGTPQEWKFDYSKTVLKLGSAKAETEYDEDDILNQFKVRNNRISWNEKWVRASIQDTDEQRIWDLFAAIAGDEFIKEHMDQYVVYRFADTDSLARVKLLHAEAPAWGLAVNAYASDFSNEKWVRDMVAVLIHEYAHILTLDKDQVNPKRKKDNFCTETYMSLKGCSEEKSYINIFVSKFWTEKDHSRKELKKTYYKKHEDEFLTTHAITNPEEDIAESFTQFILYEKPTGTKKKDLKVAFFYNYPELVKMRERIREEVKEYFN